MVGFIEGVLQIANVFLIVVAGITALTLFKSSFKEKKFAAWKPLILVLIIFAAVEIFGSLVAFKMIEPTFITHILVSIMLALLIYSLSLQLIINKSTK